MYKDVHEAIVVEPFRIGNQLWWRPVDGADIVDGYVAGLRTVKRAARHHCQSMGVLHYSKHQCYPRGVIWRVTGTTGREMWFRVRKRT